MKRAIQVTAAVADRYYAWPRFSIPFTSTQPRTLRFCSVNVDKTTVEKYYILRIEKPGFSSPQIFRRQAGCRDSSSTHIFLCVIHYTQEL